MKNLVNFRNNGLSYGMDDQFYKKKQALFLMKDLINSCGEKFVTRLLEKKILEILKNFIDIKIFIIQLMNYF